MLQLFAFTPEPAHVIEMAFAIFVIAGISDAVDLEEASGAGGESERTARRFVVAGTLGADA